MTKAFEVDASDITEGLIIAAIEGGKCVSKDLRDYTDAKKKGAFEKKIDGKEVSEFIVEFTIDIIKKHLSLIERISSDLLDVVYKSASTKQIKNAGKAVGEKLTIQMIKVGMKKRNMRKNKRAMKKNRKLN